MRCGAGSWVVWQIMTCTLSRRLQQAVDRDPILFPLFQHLNPLESNLQTLSFCEIKPRRSPLVTSSASFVALRSRRHGGRDLLATVHRLRRAGAALGLSRRTGVENTWGFGEDESAGVVGLGDDWREEEGNEHGYNDVCKMRYRWLVLLCFDLFC